MMNRPKTGLRQPRSQHGYTLVELMMAIAVFSIGVSGIIAMQKVAAAANEHSKALSVATNVAQAWTDALKADSALYNPTTGLANTVFLSQNNAQWFRPAWSAGRQIGAAFNALGVPIDEGNGGSPADARFCVHLRLAQLYPTSPGLNVMRTEIRVFWPKNDADLPDPFCTADGMTPAQILDKTSEFHFLYQVSSVRQQPQ